jgi:penicillin-binding protein 1A
LPDHQKLAVYEPPVATRVYAGDGRLMSEFATEKRVFVPIQAIPLTVKRAIISAEDKNFYSHPGVDVTGVVRAAVTNLSNLGSERRPIGASTITQQVAKNFLIGNELSYGRKVREAILALRMSRTFSKERILELYLNEIYLGHGAYGVAAAALVYFDKALDELTLAETAFLAALPKAPNNYDPVRFPEAARSRRDWVIGRMLEDGHITNAEADAARDQPVTVQPRQVVEKPTADFFAEEVRREIARRFGEKALYEGGLVVHATIDPNLQAIADRALRAGLEAYDRRHGWRGPLARLQSAPQGAWAQELAALPPPAGLGSWHLAVVLRLEGRGAGIGLANGETGVVPFEKMSWARSRRPGQGVGSAPQKAADILNVNDVIAVERTGDSLFALRQIPLIEGALVALDPHTGRVLAMSGGYAYARSEYNRATQALRQPGSAFKPFVYLAGLENGYTPSSIVLDAPFVIDQGPGLPAWKPSNYSDRYYGPTTLRVGIEQSRNVMTVRLANTVGMEKVAATAVRLGVFDQMPPLLAYALGAGETSLMRMTAAYAVFVNGGHRVTPALIDRIQDRYGRTVFRHDQRACPDCLAAEWAEQAVPQLPDVRPRVTDPHSAYQIVSMLEGVVQRGTGQRVAEVGKPLAGKTGTSNDAKDVWFVGFSPDLAVGVFVGFDEPATLGAQETGGAVAAPIFRDFMKDALAKTPAIPFRIPPDIRLVRVDPKTGRPAGGGRVIWEAFKPGTLPFESEQAPASDRGGSGLPSAGTGGLY